MSENPDFPAFMRRVRKGDEGAAAELVRLYEPIIRREARMMLDDMKLGRLLDSADVCQQVLGSFFARAVAGQYDLEQPGQLVALLVSMARNKLNHVARTQAPAQRRDARRTAGADVGELGVADSGASPSRVVAGRELLESVRQRLSDEERRIADLRADGRSWAGVADEMGGSADGRRMQLTRALDRVTRELGLDEAGDG